MHTSDKGVITELVIATTLLKLGKNIAKPLGENQRYDLVLENDGHFFRVQCKTGRLRNGVILFNTSSRSLSVNKGKQKSYRGEIDFFGVYCPENDKCYLIPVDEVGTGCGCLRVDHPKNNQATNVRFAVQFQL